VKAGQRQRSRSRPDRGGEHLKVGHRYKVTINPGDQEVTRTVKLQANTKESAVQRQLGF
jgi:hypothetical protein